MIPGGSRKRAFSNPHIGGPNDPTFVHRLNPQLYYYNKSQSGRSSFCVDESLWPTNNPNGTASETNLYMGSSTEEDYEEAIDQFSPTIYTRSASRAIPIPSSAGNSPQHHPHSQPRIASGIALMGGGGGAGGPVPTGAFSAGPSIYAYPHSPFYASSPDTSLSSPVQTSGLPGQHPHPGSRISFSYDPAFQRLQVPLISGDRRPRSPLECATVFAAVAAAATCGGAVGGAGGPGGAADTTINRSVWVDHPSFLPVAGSNLHVYYLSLDFDPISVSLPVNAWCFLTAWPVVLHAECCSVLGLSSYVVSIAVVPDLVHEYPGASQCILSKILFIKCI